MFIDLFSTNKVVFTEVERERALQTANQIGPPSKRYRFAMDPNLYNAARRGDLGHLQSLTPEQKSELPSQLAPNQNTVLHVATEFRQLEFARAVSRSYPSLLWRQNGVGDTPLHVAARESLVEHVELFVGFGMLGMVNLDGDTALHCAAREGNLGCVDRLVRADPRLCSVVNNSGESPLYLAVTAGYWEVPQVIIDNAPLWASYKGANGLTALHPALFYSNYGKQTRPFFNTYLFKILILLLPKTSNLY